MDVRIPVGVTMARPKDDQYWYMYCMYARRP